MPGFGDSCSSFVAEKYIEVFNDMTKYLRLLFCFLFPALFALLPVTAGERIKSRNEESIARIKAIEDQSKDEIRFVVLGDSRSFPKRFRKIAELINTLNPDFVIHLGDIVEHAEAREYLSIIPIFNEIKAPLIAIPGNHDIRKGKNTCTNFIKVFGSTEATFDFANFRFILVNNSEAALSKHQLEKIKEDLDTDKVRFLMMHAPPLGPYKNHTFKIGANELVDLITKSGCEYAIFSHIHGYDHRMIGENCNAFITGGGGAEMNGRGEAQEIHHVLLFTIKGNQVNYQMVPLI